MRNFYSHLITSCPVIQNFTLYAAHKICDTVFSWLGSLGKSDPEEHTFKALVSNGEGDDTLGLQGVGCGLHYTYCPPKRKSNHLTPASSHGLAILLGNSVNSIALSGFLQGNAVRSSLALFLALF